MNDIIKPVSKPQNIQPPDQPAQNAKPEPLAPNSDLEPPITPESTSLMVIKKPRKHRVWLRWLIGVVLFLLIAAIAAGIAAYFWYQNSLTPVSSGLQNKTFKVAEGSNVDQIASNLEKEGLVKSGLATQIYMRLNKKTDIKAGKYILSPNQSVAEITNWLNSGRINTLKVTILPGRTLMDLKKDLQQYGYSEADLDGAFNKEWQHPLLAEKPKGVNIEGYIYPETYFMEADSTAEDLVLRSFDEFESQIEKNDYRKKLSDRGFNLHQGITLASIINREVGLSEDQRKVSQVFQTRMQQGMNLGSDVTYLYAAKLLGTEPSPTLDSPYNTRKYAGLPPGPIANFNLTVLDAVINPANTTYLFFVAGDDGVTHYSYTFAEHEDNIAKYCHQACAAN